MLAMRRPRRRRRSRGEGRTCEAGSTGRPDRAARLTARRGPLRGGRGPTAPALAAWRPGQALASSTSPLPGDPVAAAGVPADLGAQVLGDLDGEGPYRR